MTEQLNDPFSDDWVATPKPSLNPEQQAAHDSTLDYVFGRGENIPEIILITGYAGTGKTFTINRIVESIKGMEAAINVEKKNDKSYMPMWRQIAASAPTHKAVRVMRKNAELGSNVAYFTIHSLLGLKMDHDKKTGKKIFVPSKDPEDGKIQQYDVVIIDEVSMLGTDLWTAILEAKEQYGFWLILLGDPVQIPPVNEKDSPALLDPQKYGIKVLELTQSMRQAGDNPILDYATCIRETYKSRFQPPNPFEKSHNGHGIQILQAMQVKEVDQILEDMFGSDKFRADADFMKVIAWTNRTVDQFNSKIRRMLYPVPEGAMGLPLIVNGEKLIMDERYAIPGTQGKILPTNEEVEVVNYEIVRRAVQYKTWTPLGFVTHTLNPQIYKTDVRFRSFNGSWVKATIDIVHERSKTEVKEMLDVIVKSALQAPWEGGTRSEMWRHKFHIEGLFAQVKYNYAVTAHKSQGSTYENCMLVEWDIRPNPNMEEKNRITYVGATRARNMLYIIQ